MGAVYAILACDDAMGIGKNGQLPWPNNSADMKWFKEKTKGSVVVMGKATWESLPVKPLPGRNNIVVTSSEADKDKGGYHFIKFENAKAHILNMSALQDVYIIGGAKLIEGLIEIIDRFYLTRISGNYDCDVVLPGQLIVDNFKLTWYVDGLDVTVEVWDKKNV